MNKEEKIVNELRVGLKKYLEDEVVIDNKAKQDIKQIVFNVLQLNGIEPPEPKIKVTPGNDRSFDINVKYSHCSISPGTNNFGEGLLNE